MFGWFAWLFPRFGVIAKARPTVCVDKYDPDLRGAELYTVPPTEDLASSMQSLNNIIFTMLGPGRDFLDTAHTMSNTNVADHNIVVTVRGIWSTIFVFNHLCANNQFGESALTKHHEFLMQDFFRCMNNATGGRFLSLPDVFVLLTAPSGSCLDRIRTRDRSEEQTVSLGNMNAQTARFGEFAEWMRTNGVHIITVDTSDKNQDEAAAAVAMQISELAMMSDVIHKAERPLRIMIDGAVGVGKSMVCQQLADRVLAIDDKLRLLCIDENVDRWKSLGLLGDMLNPAPPSGRRPSVAVIGNIGSGKTTFLKALGEANPDFKIIYEPVEAWRKSGMLGLFYEDKEKYACMFQMSAFVSRAELIETEVEGCGPGLVPLMERCLESDRRIFAEQLRADGTINDASWKTYTNMYDYLKKKVESTAPTCLVYLDTPPEECFNRMQKRGRPEENTVPLDYLTALHERHREWLLDNGTAAANVLVVDGKQAFHTDNELATIIADRVLKFAQGSV